MRRPALSRVVAITMAWCGFAVLAAGCGGGGAGGADFVGAGALAGTYDVGYLATVHITKPKGFPDVQFPDAGVFTIGDAPPSAHADMVLTGVSSVTGASCTILLDRTGDTTAKIAKNQSCNAFVSAGTVQTVSVAGTLELVGNRVTVDVSGDVQGSIEGVGNYSGTYSGEWLGIKRP